MYGNMYMDLNKKKLYKSLDTNNIKCKKCNTCRCKKCDAILGGNCFNCNYQELNEKIKCECCKRCILRVCSMKCKICNKLFCTSKNCIFWLYEPICKGCKNNYLENTKCHACGKNDVKCHASYIEEENPYSYIIIECQECFNFNI